ncbi:hypothetical protein F4778DRAFT_738671 [Xylariomycetidae sp. FL2044]|nr:hypothetical protein F4778DRAFT_738671 [Xylariomycetidae sp. FL2044]
MASGIPLSPEAREKMLNHPAEPPPVNVEAKFENPWSMAYSAEVTLHTLYALSTVVFLVKMYAQIRIERKLGPEDYTLVVSWLLYTGAFEPTGTWLARAPMGVHQWDITFRQFSRYLYLQYCSLIIWGLLIMFLKITILLQYLRFFVPKGTRNFTFWAVQVLLYANVAYYVAFTFLQMLSCNPREKFWDKTIMDGYCIDIFAVNVSGAVVCLASDLAILYIPQRVFRQLNMARSRMLGLCALFAIGIFACVTSAVRVYYNVRLWQHQSDVTYQLGYMSFWGTAQLPAAFLVICVPSVPRVINYARSKPWCARFEYSIRSALGLSTEKGRSTTQIVTIGGGPKQNHLATVVSDVEFRSLMATDAISLSSISHIDPASQVHLRGEA